MQGTGRIFCENLHPKPLHLVDNFNYEPGFLASQSIILYAVKSIMLYFTICRRLIVKYRGGCLSYIVCHMQKFTKGSVKGIEIHNQREKNISHSNPDIDFNRTALNYDLHNENDINFHQVINERIKSLELKKAVRKDAIVMCSFIVSSDQSFFANLSETRQKQFFKDSYDFLKNRYGEDNVIAANIHLDETTPHMHFSIVPATSDGRLSAKSIFTKTELQKIQTEIYENVGRKYGLERGKEGSDNKHINIIDLKKATREKELARLDEQINEKKSNMEKLIKQEKNIQSNIDKLKGVVSSFYFSYDTKHYIEKINPSKSFSGGLKDISIDEFNQIKHFALQYCDLAPVHKELERVHTHLSAKYSKEKSVSQNLDIFKELSKLKNDNRDLLEENRQLKNLIDYCNIEFPIQLDRQEMDHDEWER